MLWRGKITLNFLWFPPNTFFQIKHNNMIWLSFSCRHCSEKLQLHSQGWKHFLQQSRKIWSMLTWGLPIQILPTHSHSLVDAAANDSDLTLHACPSILHMACKITSLSGQWASVTVDLPTTKAERNHHKGIWQGQKFRIAYFFFALPFLTLPFPLKNVNRNLLSSSVVGILNYNSIRLRIRLRL